MSELAEQVRQALEDTAKILDGLITPPPPVYWIPSCSVSRNGRCAPLSQWIGLYTWVGRFMVCPHFYEKWIGEHMQTSPRIENVCSECGDVFEAEICDNCREAILESRLRIRAYLLPARVMVDLMTYSQRERMKSRGIVEFVELEDVPVDAIVQRVHWSHEHNAFMIVLEHPTFEMLEPCQQVPIYGNGTFTIHQVRIEHESED